MKGLLLDENVPSRLTFQPSVPIESVVEALGGGASDSTVWQYASAKDYAILTKDVDFSDRILTSTPPPRVVHIKLGNVARKEFHALLFRSWPRIESLLKSHKLIRIYSDRLEAIS